MMWFFQFLMLFPSDGMLCCGLFLIYMYGFLLGTNLEYIGELQIQSIDLFISGRIEIL